MTDTHSYPGSEEAPSQGCLSAEDRESLDQVYIAHLKKEIDRLRAADAQTGQRYNNPLTSLPVNDLVLAIIDKPCAQQFDLACKVAENVGYVLTREPDHPDSPHAVAQAAWQPIETAPKDKELLLGWYRTWPEPSWEVAAGLAGSTKGGWLHGQATHWMPQPGPPLPSTNHQSLDQLLDGMTDENRHEELPVSPPSSTEGK